MMQENNTEPSTENFSGDPIENLRVENNILKLKLQAQFGAVTEISPDLPPDIENDFLQSIQRFEEAWKDAKLIKVFDLAGRPDFKKAESLTPEIIRIELARVLKLLAEKNIYLSTLSEYNPFIIYRFITDELFEHETEATQLHGFPHNFLYEEFHPNHKVHLEEATEDFFRSWFTKNFDYHSSNLSQMMINFDGTQITHDEIVSKLNKSLNTIKSFFNKKYKILDTSFQSQQHEGRSMGYTEGIVTYDAEIDSGECVNINGPFKLYFCYEHGYWSIFYFIFPGFEW